MKIAAVFLTLVLLITLTSCGDNFDAEAEEKAVMATFDAMLDGLAKTDTDALLSLTHQNFTSYETWTDAQYTLTRADINPSWPPISFGLNYYTVMVAPDLAVLKGTGPFQAGSGTEQNVYYTAVFTKENGKWIYTHGHISYMP